MLRLFIAIPLPEVVTEEIGKLISSIKPLFKKNQHIRFIPKENWHFTLVFLGNQDESVVPKIKILIGTIFRTSDVPNIDAISGHRMSSNFPIKIEFNKLTYGPPHRLPRMIWLTTTEATSRALAELKEATADKLEKQGIVWRRENRPLQAHLTLARFEATARKNLPDIERKLTMSFQDPSLNLMQSTLKKGGAEYRIL